MASEEIPVRVQPYMEMTALDQELVLVLGPLTLRGPEDCEVDSDLSYRWTPSSGIGFEGPCTLRSVDMEQKWTMDIKGASADPPVLITSATFGTPTRVGGILNGPFDLGEGPLEVLRFSLLNFPSYLGSRVRTDEGPHAGFSMGRLQFDAKDGECVLDEIQEAGKAAKEASRGLGSVITHVGEWRPVSGSMTTDEARERLRLLHHWFGLLRAAWSGPVFPQGLRDGQVVWRQYASWILSPSREVSTWMPTRTPIDLSQMFSGFRERWSDEAWQKPLSTAIWWLVESNARETRLESSIILSQVALELLAWVHVVETQRLHSRADFKKLSAAGRIRALLQASGVPAPVPDYMPSLQAACDSEWYDGPGVITRIRNALVHADDTKREFTAALDGMTRWECAQLAIQYIELVLLSVCGYDGPYARRGWKGWKGDDEVPVPWAASGGAVDSEGGVS